MKPEDPFYYQFSLFMINSVQFFIQYDESGNLSVHSLVLQAISETSKTFSFFELCTVK